ncbi:MAG: nitroreductase [Proteobacteria bacterium]|nr:nitroreductase [Pseudomonadota bacterium]
MDTADCILTRKSVRAYKATPVPKALLTKILNEAKRSPSCANTQPWEFAVFGGEVMEEMRKAYRERFLSGGEAKPEIPYPFNAWPEPYLSRRMALSKGQHQLLGIDSNNKEQVQQFWLRGYSFFGAPNGIIIYIGDNLPTWSVLDVGIILQSILLLAHNYGLGCCAQLQMVAYPDIIRKLINIPASKKIVVGLSIGYPDEKDIINKSVTERLALGEMVTWHGI